MPAHSLGVLFAIGALFAWGAGDFLIQKSTRQIGVMRTLFYNGVFGVLILTPFIWDDILSALSHPNELRLLFTSGSIMFLAAILMFEAYRLGKLAIVEPIFGVELPLTVLLGVFLAHERLSFLQASLILVIFIGILLAITSHHSKLQYHRRIFEKGVPVAILGMLAMALTNYFVGRASQESSAVLTIWFVNVVDVILAFIYMATRTKIKGLVNDLIKYPAVVISQGIVDNIAWLFFALAMTLIPISIAVTISESYIILSVILGIFINKEKLRPHQLAGLPLAILGVIILSVISAN